MSSPEQLTNRAGVVVFEGTAAPGGSQPVQAIYQGDPVSVNDGDSGRLPFSILADGPALLDLTDPTRPLFSALGTYALTVTLNGQVLTADGFALFSASHASSVGTFATTSTFLPDKGESLNGTIVVTDASAALVVKAYNFDGVASRLFVMGQAVIVKLA